MESRQVRRAKARQLKKEVLSIQKKRLRREKRQARRSKNTNKNGTTLPTVQ